MKNMRICSVEYSCVSFSIDSKAMQNSLKGWIGKCFLRCLWVTGCDKSEWYKYILLVEKATCYKMKAFFSAAELNLKNEVTNITPVWFITDKLSFICAIFWKEIPTSFLTLSWWCRNLLTNDYGKKYFWTFL